MIFKASLNIQHSIDANITKDHIGSLEKCISKKRTIAAIKSWTDNIPFMATGEANAAINIPTTAALIPIMAFLNIIIFRSSCQNGNTPITKKKDGR